MEQRKDCSGLFFNILSCFLLLLLLSFSGSVKSYKNYTVGDSLGWYDKLLKPEVNYQKWAADKDFSLGDFLIFNTDNNHSVIQTYNFTTYKLCDYEDSQDSDTTQWSATDPSAIEPHPVGVAVPLVKEGLTYFFSSDYDGEQCNNGQQLKINVTHGQGLPASLKTPSEKAPSPANPDASNEDSAPDTVVPSNFNNPKVESDSDDENSKGKEKKTSGVVLNFVDKKLYGVFVMLSSLVYLF